MRKFEIGDRVRVIADSIKHNDCTGKTGIVSGFHANQDLMLVDLGPSYDGHYGDRNVVDRDGKLLEIKDIKHINGRWFFPYELELDKESKVLEILRNYKKLKI